MGTWPQSGFGSRVYQFNSYTNGDGIINSSASANTKGAYELMVTSTTHDIDWLQLDFSPNTFAVRDMLVDIAIGGAGAETIIIDNLHYSIGTLYRVPSYHFPIKIPAGTRLSARCQASTGSSNTEIFMHGYPMSFNGSEGCSRVETWGANTADSGGVSIDPGGTVGVMGAYAQVVASTSFDVKWLMVAFGNQVNTARTTMVGDMDIGIGAGGSEQILVQGLRFAAHSTDDVMVPMTHGPLPVSIKAGSRIACRAINYSTNDATDRLFDVIIYGIG